MNALNKLVVRFSQSAGLFILSAIVAFGALFLVFFPLNVAFAELTGGLQPFDFQNELTVEQIFEQLPLYSEPAKQLYIAFAYVDYFFPFFASLFLAALACFSLRHLSPKTYGWMNANNLFVLFFIGCAFDWTENCLALTVIFSWPEKMSTAASLLVLAKKGKLTCVLFFQAVTWILLILAALKWAGRKTGIIAQSARENPPR
jgi:hypothetical protein